MEIVEAAFFLVTKGLEREKKGVRGSDA